MATKKTENREAIEAEKIVAKVQAQIKKSLEILLAYKAFLTCDLIGALEDELSGYSAG